MKLCKNSNTILMRLYQIFYSIVICSTAKGAAQLELKSFLKEHFYLCLQLHEIHI